MLWGLVPRYTFVATVLNSSSSSSINSSRSSSRSISSIRSSIIISSSSVSSSSSCSSSSISRVVSVAIVAGPYKWGGGGRAVGARPPLRSASLIKLVSYSIY